MFHSELNIHSSAHVFNTLVKIFHRYFACNIQANMKSIENEPIVPCVAIKLSRIHIEKYLVQLDMITQIFMYPTAYGYIVNCNGQVQFLMDLRPQIRYTLIKSFPCVYSMPKMSTQLPNWSLDNQNVHSVTIIETEWQFCHTVQFECNR